MWRGYWGSREELAGRHRARGRAGRTGVRRGGCGSGGVCAPFPPRGTDSESNTPGCLRRGREPDGADASPSGSAVVGAELWLDPRLPGASLGALAPPPAPRTPDSEGFGTGVISLLQHLTGKPRCGDRRAAVELERPRGLSPSFLSRQHPSPRCMHVASERRPWRPWVTYQLHRQAKTWHSPNAGPGGTKFEGEAADWVKGPCGGDGGVSRSPGEGQDAGAISAARAWVREGFCGWRRQVLVLVGFSGRREWTRSGDSTSESHLYGGGPASGSQLKPEATSI